MNGSLSDFQKVWRKNERRRKPRKANGHALAKDGISAQCRNGKHWLCASLKCTHEYHKKQGEK